MISKQTVITPNSGLSHRFFLTRFPCVAFVVKP